MRNYKRRRNGREEFKVVWSGSAKDRCEHKGRNRRRLPGGPLARYLMERKGARSTCRK